MQELLSNAFGKGKYRGGTSRPIENCHPSDSLEGVIVKIMIKIQSYLFQHNFIYISCK